MLMAGRVPGTETCDAKPQKQQSPCIAARALFCMVHALLARALAVKYCTLFHMKPPPCLAKGARRERQLGATISEK